MKPYYSDESVTVYSGDCLDIIRELPEGSVDAVVTDPPYGLEFMGREWDSFKPAAARLRTREDGRTNPVSGKSTVTTPEVYVAGQPFQAWCQVWAVECLRVLKPGGYLAAFGGSRTWHRLAAAIEDAEFELRDSIAWLYGQGFPKSHDISKALDRAADAEREVIAERSNWRASTAAAGKHAYNDFVGRWNETKPSTAVAKQWAGWGTGLKPAFEPIVLGRKPFRGTVAQNVIEHGTGALNIDGCRIGIGTGAHPKPYLPNGKNNTFGQGLGGGEWDNSKGRWPTNVVLDEAMAAELDKQSGNRPGFYDQRDLASQDGVTRSALGNGIGLIAPGERRGHNDDGGASRFFPVFKYTAKAGADERPEAGGVRHPTVKPVDLMRWLVRLVTPPSGLVLDPFAGSGTTAEACVREHLRCITIEREPDYLPLIKARLTKPMEIGFDFREGA